MSDSDREVRDRSRERQVTFAFAIAAVTLAGTMLAVGGIHPKVGALFGLGCAISLVVLTSGRSNPVPRVALVFFVLAGVSLLQCVPIPIGLLAKIAPRNADVWSRALAPLGKPGPSWAPISLAPEITLVRATEWAGYGALAYVGHAWARVRGLRVPAMVALGLAFTAALTTLLHGLFGATSLFGFYQPAGEFPRWRLGPLLNSNHMSGYLLLGVYGGLALLVSRRRGADLTWRTAILLTSTASLVVGIFLLRSRTAIALLAVGMVTLPVAFLSPGNKKDNAAVPKNALLLGLSVFVLGGALAAFGYGEDVVAKLAGKDFIKVQLLRDVPAILHDHWATGFGRGAFESAFFAYKTVHRNEYWPHPENFVVQWVTEWGVPMTMLAFGLFAWAIWGARGLRVSVGARVILLGLLLLMAQNLADFGLELPSIGGLAALLFGAMCGLPGEPAKRSRRTASAATTKERRPLAGMLLGTAMAAVALAAFQRHPRLLSDLRSEALALAATTSPSAPDAYEPLIAWTLRYPAEPYLALAGASIASRSGPQAAMPWLNHALELGPRVASTHLALTDVLAREGHIRQALLETRLAAESDMDFVDNAATLAAELARSTDDLMSAVPDDPSGIEYGVLVLKHLPPSSPLRAPFRQRLLVAAPCDVELRDQAIQEALGALSTHAPPCDAPASARTCANQATADIARIEACPGGAVLALQESAELEWLAGDKHQAIELLEKSCNEGRELTPCLKRLAERAAEVHDTERLKRNVRLVTSRGCQGGEACGHEWAWAAATFQRAGDVQSAYYAATKACESDPLNLELKRQLAEAALAAGSKDRAEIALTQLLDRRPSDAAAQTRLAQIRALPDPNALPASSAQPSKRSATSVRSGGRDGGVP